jgi:HlyD family secretion protein
MKLYAIVTAVVTGLAALGARVAFRDDDPERGRKPGATDRVAANGVVEGARPEVALRPEVSSAIVLIPFRENQDVRRGDLLLELRNDTQKQQVALAQAELNAARAALVQARTESERSQRLGTGVASLEKKEADQSKYLQAQAHVEETEAKLKLAQAELARTRLLAPSNGRVLRVYAEPGEQAGPTSAQPALLLADVSRFRVRAFVEELDALRVRSGQRAEVTADGLPGRTFTGKVTEVLPRMGKRAPLTDAPEEYRDMYYREAVIDLDDGGELALNLRVKVHIHTGENGR